MKFKIMLLAAILTLGISSVSFGGANWVDRGADGSVSFTSASNSIPLIMKPSANVFFSWDVLANGTTYSIGTIHTSGTFTYATSSVDTNIYRWSNDAPTYSNANAGTSLTAYTGTAHKCPDAPADTNTSPVWTGWTASK
jgi:hypothetical protein